MNVTVTDIPQFVMVAMVGVLHDFIKLLKCTNGRKCDDALNTFYLWLYGVG